MKEPTRWLEAGNSAPARVRELFASAQPTRSMTQLELARSTAQVAQIAATPVGVLPSVLAKKIVVAILGLGGAAALVGGGAALMASRGGQDVPRALKMPALTESVAGLAPPEEPMKSGERPAEGMESRTEPAASGPAPLVKKPVRGLSTKKGLPTKTVPEDSLTREIAMLEEARRLMATSPSEAFRGLEAHAREFPEGRLATEREFLAIDTLLRLGRKDEARTRGEALLERSSGTPYEARVRRKLDEMR